MLTVAFLANQFPSPIEPYVIDELNELRRRGVRVVTGSVRRTRNEDSTTHCVAEIVLLPLQTIVVVRALWFCLRKWRRLVPFFFRIAFRGMEGVGRRLKALAHTFLGACYAVMLKGRGVKHIHVHHGYFGSWIAMVAARLLRVPFSMTLYGSDLLLHQAYLDTKLANCAFCLNVSEFNRRYILEHYPEVSPALLPVLYLGVDIPEPVSRPAPQLKPQDAPLTLLAVGRLHPVKDHAFLVRACSALHDRGIRFQCFIVGDGPERLRLEHQIRESGLREEVRLLGYVSEEERNALYDRADVVVLTSRSEGIPVVLMEAMARGKVVLAPAITGIPELVIAGETGFLYEPGRMNDFVDQLITINSLVRADGFDQSKADRNAASGRLDWICHAARVHVAEKFNRQKSVERFGELFLERVAAQNESTSDENFVLQQI